MKKYLAVFLMAPLLFAACTTSQRATTVSETERPVREISMLGNGMEPTIKKDSRISVRDLTLEEKRNLKKDEIVTYHFGRNAYTSDKEYELFKDADHLGRIIATSGDSVEVINKIIYLNGSKLDEPYLFSQNLTNISSTSKWKLSDNELFILGDNREYSVDSRFVGPISYTQVTSIFVK